ncbi:STAS domain-containing protein [Streptomyces sp. NPDC012825]|uniref:STAS domain-containing protein n=1 Tax=Streptomyces sp. NPDC012825 TaxID=3364851 RepID=UPI0036996BAF
MRDSEIQEIERGALTTHFGSPTITSRKIKRDPSQPELFWWVIEPVAEALAVAERLSVAHRMVDGIRVVTLHGEIDHTAKDTLADVLIPQDEAAAPRVVADLEGVSFMDSSGINAFILAHQYLTAAHGWLRIAGAQEAVQRVLHLIGVDPVIDCHPTVEQALNT